MTEGELPAPPEDRPDAERQAWFEGAATVAQLQADQWAIIAKQYREAAEDLGHEDDPDDVDDEDDGPGECPDCGMDRVKAMGGAVCPRCGPDND
ncbi:hypothetical protein EGH21_22555 [Halomicroarcula sp. F13]|uniref:Uncharacterized protein n=1 Tax=Haloarcula rubra TaxID=2487747 RepID=A0AAW4PXQ2_9EURY|nr:hypothetical protein [Halomicroarcula rubra]MBX0325803.1 hypothetical protein [Halomicroarcula rubra]